MNTQHTTVGTDQPVSANEASAAKPKEAAETGREPKETKPEPKKALLRRMVGRKSGATVAALMEATGWQAHSVRAALSGLRKDGLDVERRKNRKGETVYAVEAFNERA